MIRLSVNVNKVATVRNSRGGTIPNVLEAVDVLGPVGGLARDIEEDVAQDIADAGNLRPGVAFGR